jgi:hypothetical protein
MDVRLENRIYNTAYKYHMWGPLVLLPNVGDLSTAYYLPQRVVGYRPTRKSSLRAIRVPAI